MKYKISLLPCILFIFIILVYSITAAGCNSFVTNFIINSIGMLPVSPDTVAARIEHPIRPNIGFSVLWVGHSTCLIQIGSKVFLTDPIFTSTAGLISKRRIEPGIDISSIDRIDFILISHIHFDHFNYGSLSLLPKKSTLILPEGGAEYTPEFGFSEYKEMKTWEIFADDSVTIKAVPVKHFNGRYGFDAGWLNYNTYTGYVIQYNGITIFFAGDTSYDPYLFKDLGSKFNIDLALIPIAPIEPHDFMKRVHADPSEALEIFKDCKAGIMMPIHYRTFVQGMDSSLTFARDQLKRLICKQNLEDRVIVLNTGEQRILKP